MQTLTKIITDETIKIAPEVEIAVSANAVKLDMIPIRTWAEMVDYVANELADQKKFASAKRFYDVLDVLAALHSEVVQELNPDGTLEGEPTLTSMGMYEVLIFCNLTHKQANSFSRLPWRALKEDPRNA